MDLPQEEQPWCSGIPGGGRGKEQVGKHNSKFTREEDLVPGKSFQGR